MDCPRGRKESDTTERLLLHFTSPQPEYCHGYCQDTVITTDYSCYSFITTQTSFPGEGNGTPLQYSCLENSVEGGAWWAAVYGVAQSRHD